MGQRGGLGVLPTPSVVLCAGGMRSTLLLLPAFQRQQLGFWSLFISLSIICPKCTCTQLFLVPYSFFVFCCSRRCLSRCQHCSKGSQVPACLICTHCWVWSLVCMWACLLSLSRPHASGTGGPGCPLSPAALTTEIYVKGGVPREALTMLP